MQVQKEIAVKLLFQLNINVCTGSSPQWKVLLWRTIRLDSLKVTLVVFIFVFLFGLHSSSNRFEIIIEQ